MPPKTTKKKLLKTVPSHASEHDLLMQEDRKYGDIRYWDARYQNMTVSGNREHPSVFPLSNVEKRTIGRKKNTKRRRDEDEAKDEQSTEKNSSVNDITNEWLFRYQDLKPLLEQAFNAIHLDRRKVHKAEGSLSAATSLKGRSKRKKNDVSPDEVTAAGEYRRGLAVLDAGCGTSRFLRDLRDDGHVGPLHGVDLSFPAIRLAAQLGCGFMSTKWQGKHDGHNGDQAVTDRGKYIVPPTYTGRLMKALKSLIAKPAVSHYERIHSGDEKKADTDVELSVADVCTGLVTAFGPSSFDAVLDKSTMDALLCADDEESKIHSVISAAAEYGEVLRPYGKLILCTWHGLPKHLIDSDDDENDEEEDDDLIEWLQAVRSGLRGINEKDELCAGSASSTQYDFSVDAHRPSSSSEDGSSRKPWVYIFTKRPRILPKKKKQPSRRGRSSAQEDDELNLTIHEY